MADAETTARAGGRKWSLIHDGALILDGLVIAEPVEPNSYYHEKMLFVANACNAAEQ